MPANLIVRLDQNIDSIIEMLCQVYGGDKYIRLTIDLGVMGIADVTMTSFTYEASPTRRLIFDGNVTHTHGSRTDSIRGEFTENEGSFCLTSC